MAASKTKSLIVIIVFILLLVLPVSYALWKEHSMKNVPAATTPEQK